MERSDLAIVIPAFNEESTISDVVLNVVTFGVVIVVDDGSIDNTRINAERAGAIVVSHERNYGYDKALNTGFEIAYNMNCKYVITLDADGQHQPILISKYAHFLIDKQIPLVLGKRSKKARISEYLMGFYFLFRFGVHDILCGMKGYDIKLYKENNGFDHINSIGTELSFYALRNGYNFVEIDVQIKNRTGKPRFGGIIKSNFRIFRALLKIIWLDFKFYFHTLKYRN